MSHVTLKSSIFYREEIGMSSIQGNGGTDTIYIQQSGADVQYRVNNGAWGNISWPATVTNLTPASGHLSILFTTNITLSSATSYFMCGSTYLQFGSISLNSDGSIPTITVDNTTNYPGLIQNGTGGADGYANILVFNLSVLATGTTTAAGNSGWIGQIYYAKNAANNWIIGCYSNGAVGGSGGGITGYGTGTGASANLTILGCYSTGSLAANAAGGISGAYTGFTGGSVTVSRCYSVGNLGSNGGGIVSNLSGNGSGSSLTITDCYSLGNVTGTNSGGILGNAGGSNSGSVSITRCYSRGSLAGTTGGIVGINAGVVTVSNCYSSGSINSTAGGIFGTGYGLNALAYNCYTSGSGSTSGIYAGSSSDNAQGSGNYSEANNFQGGWTDSRASTYLQSVSTNWYSLTANTPYVLRVSGYSIYSARNITGSYSLNTEEIATILVGGTSAAALRIGPSYSLLEVNGSSSFSGLSINATTGAITGGIALAAGSYSLLLYTSEGSSYAFITYTLTVNPLPIIATGICCGTSFNRTVPANTLTINVKAGAVMNVDIANNLKKGIYSYPEYMKALQARRR